MLIYIIILFLVLITLYFSTKEGLNEVTDKSITDNYPIPSNAAVYNTPIQMMDKIKSILNGNQTKEDEINEKLKKQNTVVKNYDDDLKGKILGKTSEFQGLQNTAIPGIQDNINGIKIINGYYNDYITEANRLNTLCNENGPTNKFIVDQPTLKGITDYIIMLDTVYDNLKIGNTYLMDRYKKYTEQPATNFTKVTANFIKFPDDTLDPNIYVAKTY